MSTTALTKVQESFAGGLWTRLQRQPVLRPNVLADILRYTCISTERATAIRNVIHNYLLLRTLEHASEHVPYYRVDSGHSTSYAAWAPDRVDAPPNLSTLPVLRRETVRDRSADFVADDVRLRSICHTSGTTGVPLDLLKSHEEVAYINAFYRHFLQPVRSGLRSLPLILTLPNVNHGVAIPMPSVGMPLVAGVTDDILIRDAHRILTTDFNLRGYDPRVSIVTGLLHDVLLLTNYLHEQSGPPRGLNLNSLTVTGGFLAMNWLKYLSESWGCTVFDRFTLTEAIGGALRIPGSDTFELDSHLIGEIVDVDDDTAPADVGALVLTTPYPFVQMQPLIRYRVGDLVRRIPGEGPLRFQFLGKVDNCVSVLRRGRREWLFFPARLNELVGSLADVNLREWYSNVHAVADRTVPSLPLVATSARTNGGRTEIDVSIELRYSPTTRVQRVEEVRQYVIAGLRAAPGTTLAARMDAGDVVLTVNCFSPGTLPAPLKVKV